MIKYTIPLPIYCKEEIQIVAQFGYKVKGLRSGRDILDAT